MAMNHECKTTYNSNKTNNAVVINDSWNDNSESEIIDELPRLSIGLNDGNLSASRRVSFPKSDSDLVTGYLEPANPWESATKVKSIEELKTLYEESCRKHNTEPLSTILDHLQSLELNKSERQTSLNLKNTILTPESCEALEEIFKRVQYALIDLSACNLNDIAGTALFDMIEYYEAANELDISDNPGISSRGWQSCISMIRRSRALQILTARGIVLSELNAANLGKSLNQSCLHTIKLEHCGLTGRPLASLCNSLRKNTTLRELWIAYNDLSDIDAEKIADLLKSNLYLEFLDISNNNIKDVGVKQIVIALIEQSTNLQFPIDENESVSSLNVHNNIKNCDEISSPMLSENSNDITTKIETEQNYSIAIDDSSPSTKNLNSNIGRSMLDTLLNMNQTTKSKQENSEIISSNATTNKSEDRIQTDDNENNKIETKTENMIVENEISSELDCLTCNQKTCEKITGDRNNGLQDDNSTMSVSLTPTPSFNVNSSFSTEKYSSSDLLLQKKKEHCNNKCFKTNNNVDNNLSFIPIAPQSAPPVLPLFSTPTFSLSQISNSSKTTLDINKNNRMMEEFDSNSSDSAFESASEGDTKILIENFSKINNYARLPLPPPLLPAPILPSSASSIIHPVLENQQYPNDSIEEQQQQMHKSQEHFDINSKLSFDTKESNIIINNESPGTTILSEMRNRSLSSDSLSSDNSTDSTTGTSQISTKINEKLTKNDTLTRQKHNDELQISNKKPKGLQALILWNNDITIESAEYIVDLLDSTKSLELLNIGKNILSNEFLKVIKNSLQRNTTVSNLGLQSTHLNSEGIKILAEVLHFGGNNTLQRVDIRDNNIQVEGLAALADALKSNNSITRIDIDHVPKRIPEDGSETQFHYSRMLHTVRSLCSKNQTLLETPSTASATATACSSVKLSRHYMSSRKISLTCQSLQSPLPDVGVKNELVLSDTVKKRSGARLRSPLPSPPTISPSSSPVPSPSRNRFQVFRVIEKSQTQASDEKKKSPSPPVKEIPTTRFSRFRVTMVECPKVLITPVAAKQEPTMMPTVVKNDEKISQYEQKYKKESSEQNLTTEADQESTTISKKVHDLQISINLDKNKSVVPEMCNVEIQTSDDSVLEEFNKTTYDLQGNSLNESIEINSRYRLENLNQMENNENILKLKQCSSVEQMEQSVQENKETKILEVESVSDLTHTQSPLKETSNIPCEVKNDSPKPVDADGRTRRVSWISSGNYPTTVDKLLNLFQHPGALFSRSVSPENNDKNIDDSEISSQSLIPLRKQSPQSLFQWHKTQSGDNNVISTNFQSYVRGITDFGKHVFKHNVLFMDSISTDMQQQQCKSIPTDIKMEIKENISPENTITKNSIVSLQSINPAPEMIDMSSSRQIAESNEFEEFKNSDNSFTTEDSSYSLNQEQE